MAKCSNKEPGKTTNLLVRNGITMKNLTATLCLTLAVLLGSAGVSVSQDFQVGLDAARKGDFATALREWTPLAEQGDDAAQFNLGLMYRNGLGILQDYKTAMKWFTLAAEQGVADAQTSLGVMYYNGRGVPPDYATAAKWYTLAAEQGDAHAQFHLGELYYFGEGVPPDYATAAKWFTLAAEQGVAHAQFNLGVMYNQGEGVIQDDVYAHMWGNIAASNGNEDGGWLRDMVAEQMTLSQIQEAQTLARECIRKNYKGC
jgi:TPR repeat protein